MFNDSSGYVNGAPSRGMSEATGTISVPSVKASSMNPSGIITTAYAVNGCSMERFNLNVAVNASPFPNEVPFSTTSACGMGAGAVGEGVDVGDICVGVGVRVGVGVTVGTGPMQ